MAAVLQWRDNTGGSLLITCCTENMETQVYNERVQERLKELKLNSDPLD